MKADRKKNVLATIIGLSFAILAYAGDKTERIQKENTLRKEINQYGITWEFDKPAQCGQFINGDWWVIGPVTVVKITPGPGALSGISDSIRLNHWNDTSLKSDTTMRNGSMIVLKAGYKQGYDSRESSYDRNLSVDLPLKFEPGLSLVSTISNAAPRVDNFCKDILWENEYKSQIVLNTAAVLTCLKEAPPADAFRPPYTGTDKPIYRAKDIRWELLPTLKPVGEVPSWEKYERYFQRPWLDHLISWSQQELVPNENQPNYGREYSRLVSIASLMLCLDVPVRQKETLAVELIQLGIDLHGLAMNGGSWNEGGGHSSGRKWPILFAGIMLQSTRFFEVPEKAFFQEDTQTYYGKGWFGQNVLWQMIQHHGQRDTYEERPPGEWEQWDKTSENYRVCCNAVAWVGTALAARYMKVINLWGHDAYFDYVDRWMREDDPYKEARGENLRPSGETETFDPFVTEMWKAYRQNAPEQQMSGVRKKWIWKGNEGEWVTNGLE